MKTIYLVWEQEFYGSVALLSVHNTLLSAQRKLQEKFDEQEELEDQSQSKHYYMEERELVK